MSQHKRTAVQQRRVEELQDENGWPRIYTEQVQGATVVGQFRRYVTRQDSACIAHALYDFLMGVCGFIAEYGLVPPDGGFRIKWAEPASLIEELARGGGLARRGTVQHVYSDGMTDIEVLAAIEELADEHQAACRQGREQRAFQRDISAAIRLLEPHGFMIVPPGCGLAKADEHPCGESEQPPASLAAALAQMAAHNGFRLITPPAVEPDGQVRLL